MRQPAYVFNGPNASGSLVRADQGADAKRAAHELDKTEDQKFRRSRNQETHAVNAAEIPDKESG